MEAKHGMVKRGDIHAETPEQEPQSAKTAAAESPQERAARLDDGLAKRLADTAAETLGRK